jgi:AcrR family transcriptional regulator
MTQKTKEKEERKSELVKRIVDIIIDTGKEPTVKEIITNSTISRRTLFNYYGKKDELYRDIGTEVMNRIRSKFLADFNPDDSSFENLIASIIKKRVEIYKYINPIREILERKKLENKSIQENFKNNIHNDIDILARRLDRFIKNTNNPEETLIIIHTILSWNNWHYLTNELELPDRQVEIIMIRNCVLAYMSNNTE